MKASVGSGILLIVLLLLVGLNAFYIHQVTDEMTAQISALPEQPNEKALSEITKFQEYLGKNEPYLRLTVSYSQLDRVGELAESLRAYTHDKAPSDYSVTRTLLLDAIKDMGRLEKLWITSKGVKASG